MKRKISIVGVLLAAVLLGGCAADKSIYSWGGYEEHVYRMYSKPDKATPEIQIKAMEEDYEKARSKNKPMHPGFHAHLGYLYYQTGKMDQARKQFETEKAGFPESAVLMDRLLAKLK
ncbi:MAG: DUF4810 domain-containing protein [Verrucomicrobia bacterium]|nr:DUF4810 domain-containing protein [Verrucomicrobiota bacterium]